MSQLGEIRGCDTEADIRRIRQECERLLDSDEEVGCVFQLTTDLVLLTEWRLLIVDKQALSGKKIEYISIPYPAIARFSVEAAGSLDLDAELRIWTSTGEDPLRMQFDRSVNVYTFQAKLARKVGLSRRAG
jgi:hypothetical protein